ncbi:hypothetical protein [Leptolyngbya sp. PCC 6406]|uniref:hypothetical protein n=1 Tax=Leptolyngbya sp. PCC 6406 TaxID=1173264 RepID=UPI0002ABE0A8|nr:hypothetical protein [Leptolyngbya sp. PCC 6406]
MMAIISTLGTPRDITLQELRIETLFPADAATAAILQGKSLAITDTASPLLGYDGAIATWWQMQTNLESGLGNQRWGEAFKLRTLLSLAPTRINLD